MKYPFLINLKERKKKSEKKSRRSLDIIRKLLDDLEYFGGDILTLSKKSINYSINSDLIKADISLKKAEKKVNIFNKNLLKARNILRELLGEINNFQNTYSKIELFEKKFSGAKEEFFEAKILYSYIKSDRRKILGPENFPLADIETYAGGLSDFCGELLRRAKLDIIKKSNCSKEIEKYYQDTKAIYQILAKFSFSNKSGIRSKVDNLKGYISEFENLFYDLKINKVGS